MDLFPQDNDVELYQTAFDDKDLLKRKPISEQLSDLVQRIESPIVIALDDQWGSGKSYFLKRWVAAHTQENEGTGRTVYFDAFENDYLNDPLISLISAVAERIETDEQSKADKLRKIGGKLVKPALDIGIALATAGLVKNLGDIADAGVKAVGDQAKTAIDNMWADEKDRKEAVKEFKDLLVKFTKTTGGPIIIVVDELDRCRPDYALSVLEIIKHFFAVPRVHFVLGVNSNALENSVRARYGAGIDATGYLKKFINVKFSLPRLMGERGDVSTIITYAEKLSSDMSLPDKPVHGCLYLIRVIADVHDFSLRDIDHILSRIALLPAEVQSRAQHEGWINIMCTLLVTSVLNPSLHQKLVNVTATATEIRDYFGATREKTYLDLNGAPNSSYNPSLTKWFVTIALCCCVEEPEDIEQMGWSINDIKRLFGYRSTIDYGTIPQQIQREWIDLFRL